MLRIKRAYEEPAAEDGRRILIDRLWPRGLTKADASIDEWLKDLAPSKALRQWFHHEVPNWEEFRKRYLEELSEPAKIGLLERIGEEAKRSTVTLIYSARDTEHNDARVLCEVIGKLMNERAPAG